MHQEKVQQEKLKAVKARLNFEEVLQHSKSGTPSRRKDLRKRLGYKHVRSISGSPELRRDRSESPRKKGPERKTVFKRLEKGVFHSLGDNEKGMSAYSSDSRHRSYYNSRSDTESSSRSRGALSKGEDSAGGHWKSRSKRKKLSVKEDDLSQPWVCKETDPLTPRIRYFDFLKTRMPSHIKTYDGSEDPEDLLKIFQAAAKMEHLPKESLVNYDDLKKDFLENYLQQKKCIKYQVKIHNIKQRDGESIEEFVRRYKLECKDVKGTPECMKISGFMHEITNPELIKRLHDKIPKSVDKMIRVTTAFLRGEVAASNRERKKSFPSWKQQEAGQRQNFKKGSFRNQQRSERKQDIFTLLTKTPKEILALDKGKFKPPPPMTTSVEKRNASKFCEFHGEVGHTTDECMHLKRQIKEMLKAGKLSHLIKDLKQNNGKDQAKAAKKDGTEGPMIIEAEICTLCLAVCMCDGGSVHRILYEYCFNRFRPEVRSQMIPAATPLVGFSGEIIWPMGQISMLVKIGDEEHSTLAWMNFMVVRSLSPYNGIIGRPVVRRIWAVPSMAHRMLKFPVTGGTVTLQSSKIIPLECTEYPEQTIAIGSALTEEGRKELCELLRRNLDIFAWKLVGYD
ncbi:reverse transcriptase domain-containing protein [Tanacetum coccineum]